MRWLLLTAVVGAALLFQGCLSVEYLETEIKFSDDNESATVTFIYRDISSGESDVDDVKKDFESLIDDWKNDDYLLDRAAEGYFVKERTVFVENGRIVAREMGITKKIDEVYPIWVNNGERIMLIKEDEGLELVESNGKIFETGKNTLVTWPEQDRVLYIKQRVMDLGESHVKNRSVMIEMLEEYTAKNE